MKVLDLACDVGHSFEGWFGSEDDYLQQRQQGLLTCPACGSAAVEKKLSAPRLNLGATAPGCDVVPAADADAEHARQARLWRAVREVLAHTEDVGAGFAEEARRIHKGRAPERGIRGQASAQEVKSLLEDGVQVMPLPLPADMKETLQ